MLGVGELGVLARDRKQENREVLTLEPEAAQKEVPRRGQGGAIRAGNDGTGRTHGRRAFLDQNVRLTIGAAATPGSTRSKGSGTRHDGSLAGWTSS